MQTAEQWFLGPGGDIGSDIVVKRSRVSVIQDK